MQEQLQLRLEFQENPVVDEVSAMTAVVRPILIGLLYALKEEVVAEVGGRANPKKHNKAFTADRKKPRPLKSPLWIGRNKYTVMNIESIDHIVLTVKNIDRTCAFYARVLGMKVSTFGAGRKALIFGRQKINLHEHGNEFEPRAKAPTPGSADVCFVTTMPITQVLGHLRANGVEVLEGPVQRAGAVGPIISAYFRDPDGNLVEVSNCENA
jgi:catechol 2,3-dioxygenase-like lactoylglutathione lyase family enzyme